LPAFQPDNNLFFGNLSAASGIEVVGIYRRYLIFIRQNQQGKKTAGSFMSKAPAAE